MSDSEILCELWRGQILESFHRGHAIICDRSGNIIQSWGDPSQIIYPRSSGKMLQAIALIETGAAEKYQLSPADLALACASHQGAHIHTQHVKKWLSELGYEEKSLKCGVQFPRDRTAANELIVNHQCADQTHNNCSGKHAGFLSVVKHLNLDAEYVEPDHYLQKMILDIFEDMTDMTSSGYGIDGCSAPNYATSLQGFATAIAKIADPSKLGAIRKNTAITLQEAMMAFPELVAGEGRACTELMNAAPNKVALKTGAEGVYAAILPKQGWGIALKIEDGSMRGAECAIAALLVRAGILDASHPSVMKRLNPRTLNFAKRDCGEMRPSNLLYKNGASF